MIIKVCGMREPENIRAAEAAGTDWMGFILWPGSKRYVAQRPAYLPTRCKRVGVFVDAPLADVRQMTRDFALDIIQLHGHESAEYIKALHGHTIVKAISVGNSRDLDICHSYDGLVDYFLFDTKCKTTGGSGRQFDWTMLDRYDGTTPFVLSGGIGPDDAERLKALHHPMLAGIDLNSRFETAPAIKDIALLRRFLNSQFFSLNP